MLPRIYANKRDVAHVRVRSTEHTCEGNEGARWDMGLVYGSRWFDAIFYLVTTQLVHPFNDPAAVTVQVKF